MPVIFQKSISREDLRRNPRVLYVFGDNISRKGYGGQARAMRNEPNAVGVATKYSPNSYFVDEPQETLAQNAVIDNDMKPLFAHVRGGGIVIWPADGIGTGLARLDLHAPSTFTHLQQKLNALLDMAELFERGASAHGAV